VGKSPVSYHRGLIVENFPVVFINNEELVFPTSLFSTGVNGGKLGGNDNFLLNISYFSLNLQWENV